MTKREIAKLCINMKYGMKGVKGMTFEEAIRKYYAKGIAIKRNGTGKLIQSLSDTMTVKDALADDWIPAVKMVEPNDVRYRKVKFIAVAGYDIKYAYMYNEEAHKEGWLILEDDKITGIISNTEMAAKVENTLCVEIQGKEAEELEALVGVIKILF